MKRLPDAGMFEYDQRIGYFNKGENSQNFGDYIPELIAAELFTHPRVQADMYLLVGSIIEHSFLRLLLYRTRKMNTGRIAIWGCGKRNEASLPDEVKSQCEFFAVRGPKSRDALDLPKTIPMGDPGLLAPLFHEPNRNAETAGKMICVPHIHDPKSRELLLQESGAEQLIEPTVQSSELSLRKKLDEIASAKFVLCGSLHAAIFAFAYDVPFAFWNSGHIDTPFKWEDFSESVNIPFVFVSTCQEGAALYEDTIKHNRTKIKMTPLLEACPFLIRPEKTMKAMMEDGLISEHDALSAIDQFSNLGTSQINNRIAAQAANHKYYKKTSSIKNLKPINFLVFKIGTLMDRFFN